MGHMYKANDSPVHTGGRTTWISLQVTFKLLQQHDKLKLSFFIHILTAFLLFFTRMLDILMTGSICFYRPTSTEVDQALM